MRFGWLKKMEWQAVLSGDYLEMARLIGIDNFVLLMQSFQKLNVYFTTEQLQQPMLEYILQNTDTSAHDLARELGISERYVQKLKSRNKSRLID